MGIAIGIAELLAAFGGWIGVFNTPASPLNSLGQTFIQFTPEWLKEFAIQTFGQNDKNALTGGMVITLFLVALVIGIVARRSPRIAVGITVALILVTAAAVFSRSGASLVDVIPILLGGAAGVYFLVSVFRQQVVPGHRDIRPALPMTASSTDPSTRQDNPKPAQSGAAHPMGIATSSALGRRQFFKLAGIGAVIAIAGGAIAKWIPSGADVAASRAGVALPTPADVQQIPDVALNVDGITPFVTEQCRLLPRRHLLRGAAAHHRRLAAQHSRPGRQRDHAELRGPDRHAVHRADDHPDLRLQRGRRRPGRQCHAGRGSGSRTS